jgi:hypothetical protein
MVGLYLHPSKNRRLTMIGPRSLSQLSVESKLAAMVATRYLAVRPIIGDSVVRVGGMPQVIRGLIFLGSDPDADLASEVYEIALAHFKNRWRSNKVGARSRLAFALGLYTGICEKLDQAGLAKNLLWKSASEMEVYLNAVFGQFPIPDPESDPAMAALQAGFDDGKKIEIAPLGLA